ncbi:methyltransferase domain-containing protein [Thioalkalivibrio thiocyanodenitrificans]|uniref:methyltransferase domain-containing protein n=1 Tax=Thioalkalivibrio thiocyanodenitrificans TaxID=243063 RepID=UPI000376F692|nr:methyltransferase domain-containing protein [Thioalkalivibrio thiocyanodenitrificans]
MPDPFEHTLPDLGLAASGERPERVDERGTFGLALTLHWTSGAVNHSDCLVTPRMKLGQDRFPPELEAGLHHQPAGAVTSHRWPDGAPLPGYRGEDVLSIEDSAFNRHLRRVAVEPRAGRFYPRGFIAGVRGLLREDRTPFRMGSVDDGRLTIDLNHPMAGRDIEVQARILDISRARRGGAACHDVVELAAYNGPGMQARWRGRPTDFRADDPFRRADPQPDHDFYRQPRFVQHLDRTALAHIRRLYRDLIPPGADILDLMSSWVSHLDDVAVPRSVTGLGMNAEELGANPLLTEHLVHDLNAEPRLPRDDQVFDAVVCTVSVEYLIHPVAVFREVRRVLRPGGRFILTFSDRWFPPKAIALWQDLHEFERMGLVLEYFFEAGGFDGLNTWSLRGLPRPDDDKYADRLTRSDPIFAVWGEKYG